MTMLRAFAIAAGVALAGLSGCVTTEERTRFGDLPNKRFGVKKGLSASTHMASGHLLERQGNYRAALVQYRKALELAPNLVGVQNRLGITLNKLGRHSEATAEFRQALAQQPNAASLHNNLGFSLYLEGQLEEAECVLARALDLQPAFRRARMNHALLLGKLGRYEEALAEFCLAGSEEDAYYNLAVVQADAGHYAAAARALEKALGVNPDFAPARDQLRQISYLAAAQEAEAKAAQQMQVVADESVSASVDLELAEDVQVAGDVESAEPDRLPAAEPATSVDPTGRARLLEQIEELVAAATKQGHFARGRTNELIAVFDEWIEAWSLDASRYEGRLYRIGEYTESVDETP